MIARKRLMDLAARPEWISYSQGNNYAIALVPHLLDTGVLVQELWREKYATSCPEALMIAAEWHDCDHLFPPELADTATSRVRLDTRSIDNKVYGTAADTLKRKAHPENCAAIFRELNPEIIAELADDIAYIIEKHEVGKTESKTDSLTGTYDLGDAADIMCEADGVSFFRTILPFYIKQCIEKGGDPLARIRAKMKFSYEKLTQQGRARVDAMEFDPVEHMGHTVYPNVLINEIKEH